MNTTEPLQILKARFSLSNPPLPTTTLIPGDKDVQAHS